MPNTTFPAFPNDIPTHPLLIIDYKLIKARVQEEIDRLWEAGKYLGFWYLKNHGVDEEANGMFDLGAETMGLPIEEKMKFEQGDGGTSFGYKAAGAHAVDETGLRDSIEFINIAKDDIFAWPKQARRAYPSTVNARMESTIAPFARKSMEINNTILEILNDKLGLPPDTLARRHIAGESSTCEARVTKSPPSENELKLALGSHTDFGSLTILHNRLGGLQVLAPGSESWQYVKPIPGHAICNIGDAIALFSGGILRSGLHRVLPPPGAQSHLERWSIGYFTRPKNSVVLRALVEDSHMIADAVTRQPDKCFETGSTAEEWFERRVRYYKLKNWKGPETWLAGRGTENL